MKTSCWNVGNMFSSKIYKWAYFGCHDKSKEYDVSDKKAKANNNYLFHMKIVFAIKNN